MKKLQQEQVLSVLTSVPGAPADFESYCKHTGDVLIKTIKNIGYSEYLIRKNT